MADFDPTSIPFPFPDGAIAIHHFVALTMAHLQGWTSQSVAVWGEFTGYRLVKAYHCKNTNSSSEHEFIIYEFVDESMNKLVLRTDHHIGARKHTSSPSCSTPSLLDDGLSPISSLPASSSSSNQYLANDTITRIQALPHRRKVLRTITFNGDSSLRPSLWDVVILVLTVHKDSAFYTIHARQCYWFADSIFGCLEKWPAIRKNGRVDEKRNIDFGSMTGSLEHIAKIWDDFHKESEIMTQQKEVYERVRTEEIERRKRLAEQVEVLTSERAKDKRESEERERQLRKEQKGRERRHQEEQRLLKQELAKLQRELQQKDRELPLRRPASRADL